MEDFFSLLNGALEDLWLGVVGYKSQQFGCTVLIGSTDSFVAWLSFWAVHWACFMSLIWHMGHFQDPPEADLRNGWGTHAQWGGTLSWTNRSDIKQWGDEEDKTCILFLFIPALQIKNICLVLVFYFLFCLFLSCILQGRKKHTAMCLKSAHLMRTYVEAYEHLHVLQRAAIIFHREAWG